MRLIWIFSLLLLSGCDFPRETLPLQPSALPQGGVQQSLADEKATGNPAISCPSDAPQRFTMNAQGLSLTFDFVKVVNVQDYQVQIERQDWRNQWVLVATLNTTPPASWRGQEGSRYRARVRSRRCGDYGAWSPFQSQSTAGPLVPWTPPVVPPESPKEPKDCEWFGFPCED